MKVELMYIKKEHFQELAFVNFDKHVAIHGKIRTDLYEVVYRYDMEYEWLNIIGSEKASVVLEDIFYMFNVSHPEDFKERSLSVGDVVVIDDQYKYFIDSFGFIPIERREIKV